MYDTIAILNPDACAQLHVRRGAGYLYTSLLRRQASSCAPANIFSCVLVSSVEPVARGRMFVQVFRVLTPRSAYQHLVMRLPDTAGHRAMHATQALGNMKQVTLHYSTRNKHLTVYEEV